MTAIEILISYGCDRQCAYCVAKSRKEAKNNERGDYKAADGYINMPQLKKWLRFQKEYLKDIQVVISGGEPTMNRIWIELLEWLFQNDFQTPIVYTNGLNLKDLLLCETEPCKLAKIMLTHHHNSRRETTRGLVDFMRDLGVRFLVKGLVSEDRDDSEFVKSLGVPCVMEGVKLVAPDTAEERLKVLEQYPNPLDGSSPYAWRWNGYGDRIDRERFKFSAGNYVLTVDGTGSVFNCHFFGHPVGSIYELGELRNLQPACCVHIDTIDLSNPGNCELRCEILHYANLIRSIE